MTLTEEQLMQLYEASTPEERLILDHDLNKSHSTKKYREQVLEAVKIVDDCPAGYDAKQKCEHFKCVKERHEIGILKRKRELFGTKIHKRNGSYNFSKLSDNSTYKSNKNAITRAIETGVPLLDNDGNPVPKNHLAKQAREIDGGKIASKSKSRTVTPATPDERLYKYGRLAVEAARDLIAQGNPDDYLKVRGLIGDLHNEISSEIPD